MTNFICNDDCWSRRARGCWQLNPKTFTTADGCLVLAVEGGLGTIEVDFAIAWRSGALHPDTDSLWLPEAAITIQETPNI